MTNMQPSAKLSVLEVADPRRVSERHNMLAEGRGALNWGALTLAANAGSTVVSNVSLPSTGHVTLTPTSAHASAEIAAGTLYVSARANGSFTLTHANNAQTDRTFTYGWQS